MVKIAKNARNLSYSPYSKFAVGAAVLRAAWGAAVFFAVDKELGLTDDSEGAAQLGHQLVQVNDLVYGEGLDGLLAVTEGGVGDPDVLGHIPRPDGVVE